jgi:hypothetical protein
MDTAAPTFITTRELDVFLGGGERGPKKRQRLSREHLLPSPAQLGRVNRINIAMFPRFALAGLVGDLKRLNDATECLTALTERTFRVALFSQLADAVRLSVKDMDEGWRFDRLVADVVEHAQPAMAEWNSAVSNAEHELHQRFGITFSTAFGVVERVSSGLCIVTLADGGSETFDADRMATPVEKGRAVAIERVRVMDNEMNFLMPSTLDIPDADERALSGWLVDMMTTPAEPAGVEDDSSTAEPLPYARRSAPRRARWRGSSTMTRVPAAG